MRKLTIKATALAVASVAALAVLALAGSAGAVATGVNGKIFYTSNASGSYNVWSVGPDGTGATQLTSQSTNSTGTQYASADADGGKVAYSEFGDINGHFNTKQIWIMNGDGSGQTQLTSTVDNLEDNDPSISPDGSRIVFERIDEIGTAGQQIWIMNADGSGQTQLTSTTDGEKMPRFSPDGTKIVYVRATTTNQIWLMNADGSDQHVLLDNPGVQDVYPTWSPDGTKIAYVDSTGGLSVMNADGSNPTSLLDGSGQPITTGFPASPTWSPDGTTIAFYAAPGGAAGAGIYTVPAAGGSDPQELISLTSDFQSVSPSWAGKPAAPPPVVTHLLSVTRAGTGSGTVTSAPVGVSCGGTCSHSYTAGTTVTLTAAAAPGSEFDGWSGAGCGGTGTCTVTLSTDLAVNATFTLLPIAPAPPDTLITKATLSSKKKTAAFAFRAVGAATGFQCRLAKGAASPAFGSCTSPKAYTKLKPAKYTFQVRAVNGAAVDPTPAQKKFTIAK